MLLKNIFLDGKKVDILIENGVITNIGDVSGDGINCSGLTALPSLCDLHVHLREPGFEHKETVYTGSLAARNGGFSDVFCMPNTKPACDNADIARFILSREAMTRVHPVCAITKGQKGGSLCDFGQYKAMGILAVSDDGMPVEDDEMLERAMLSAKKNGLLLISHCENKAYVSDRLNIPSEAEYTDVIRVLSLAVKTGASVHIAHISTKESVKAVREAKRAGANVTAETCPHYFTLTKDAFFTHGTNAMMNPPLRDNADKEAIIEGICDGTFDMISTDHAPHSDEEKAVSPEKAPFGIIGLETSFPLSYSALVLPKIISLDRLVALMSRNPALRGGLTPNKIEVGAEANIFAVNLSEKFVFNKEKCLSKARNTPFSGTEMTGRAVYSLLKGELFECQPIF